MDAGVWEFIILLIIVGIIIIIVLITIIIIIIIVIVLILIIRVEGFRVCLFGCLSGPACPAKQNKDRPLDKQGWTVARNETTLLNAGCLWACDLCLGNIGM